MFDDPLGYEVIEVHQGAPQLFVDDELSASASSRTTHHGGRHGGEEADEIDRIRGRPTQLPGRPHLLPWHASFSTHEPFRDREPHPVIVDGVVHAINVAFTLERIAGKIKVGDRTHAEAPVRTP